MPPPEAITPPIEAAQTRFALTGASVEHSTVFNVTELRALYAPLIGKEVSLLDIYKLRDAITAKYRAAGFVLSQAIIPPQRIEGGVVRLEVIEGFINAVTVEGDSGDRRNLVERIARKLSRARPLNERDLERAVLLIGDLPGVEARTVLKPSENTPGAAELVVVVTRRAFAGSVSADNRGSLAIGPEQFSVAAVANSLLGQGEQTTLQLVTTRKTRELRYLSLGHEDVLSADGLRLGLSASLSRSQPGGSAAILETRGEIRSFRANLSQPIVRSREKTLTIGTGVEILDSSNSIFGFEISDDRVRLAYVDLAFDYADTWFGDRYPASSLVRARIDRGLNGWGATRTGSFALSRADAVSDFTKISGEVTRLQRLTSVLSLSVSAAGQYSLDPLLSSQQFGLGGARFGRGYEPSEILGDSGVAVSVEARVAPWATSRARLRPQLYAFYDAGVVWLKDTSTAGADRSSLSSAGVGVSCYLGRAVLTQFEIAKPLTRQVASRGNEAIRPLFSISTAF